MRVKLLEARTVNGKPKIYRKAGRSFVQTAAKGAVLEVSDATGRKWIDAKKAVETSEPVTMK